MYVDATIFDYAASARKGGGSGLRGRIWRGNADARASVGGKILSKWRPNVLAEAKEEKPQREGVKEEA